MVICQAVFDKANEMKDTRLLRAEMDVVAWATWNTLRDEGILNTVESAPWEEGGVGCPVFKSCCSSLS